MVLPIYRSYGTNTVSVFIFYQYFVPNGTLQIWLRYSRARLIERASRNSAKINYSNNGQICLALKGSIEMNHSFWNDHLWTSPLHQSQAPEVRHIRRVNNIPLLWSFIVLGVLAITISPLRGYLPKTKMLRTVLAA